MDMIVAELFKYGLPGICIAYLAWCCLEKDKRYDRREVIVNALQESRVTERAENAKAMAETAEAVSRLSESIEVAVETMAAATRAMVDATREIVAAVDAMERRRR